jgi:hypothetical protein
VVGGWSGRGVGVDEDEDEDEDEGVRMERMERVTAGAGSGCQGDRATGRGQGASERSGEWSGVEWRRRESEWV